jgi:hypothetical protein
MSALQVARLQQQVRRLVCSAPWFDRCWSAFVAGDLRNTNRADHALDRNQLYPPGGVRGTAMRRCVSCGSRWYPPQYVRAACGLCDDCAAALQLSGPETDERTHVPSTESPSAVAFRQIGYFRVHLVQQRLAAEDESSLRREIRDFRRRAKAAGRSCRSAKNTEKHDY